LPESTTNILNVEYGGMIFYPEPPVCINGNINFRLIGKQKRYLPTGIFSEPARYIYSLSNGCIIGPTGLCYDAEKRAFIAESAKEWVLDLRHSPYTNIVN